MGLLRILKAKYHHKVEKKYLRLTKRRQFNLTIDKEIIEAVKKGMFHIFPVANIDQGIEILTGVKAGQRKPDGIYEKDTINFKVNKKLASMADKLREFQKPPSKKKRMNT